MTSDRRNCITPRESMSGNPSVFQREILLSFGRHKSHLMWLRRVDGGCLSYGTSALPAHLHFLPTPFFRFCAGDIDEYMDIFLDTKAIREAVIQAGIAICQYIYRGPDTTFGRNSLHVLKEGGGRSDQIRDSTSNKGAVAQHALPTYTCRPRIGSFYRASLNPSEVYMGMSQFQH